MLGIYLKSVTSSDYIWHRSVNIIKIKWSRFLLMADYMMSLYLLYHSLLDMTPTWQLILGPPSISHSMPRPTLSPQDDMISTSSFVVLYLPPIQRSLWSPRTMPATVSSSFLNNCLRLLHSKTWSWYTQVETEDLGLCQKIGAQNIGYNVGRKSILCDAAYHNASLEGATGSYAKEKWGHVLVVS